MKYNKSLVEQAAEEYASYIRNHWHTGNNSEVMGHRQYKALKEQALVHALSKFPVAKLGYDSWLKLQHEHANNAHSFIVNQPQETGRRLMMRLGWVLRNHILNDDKYNVMKPDGRLMGRYGVRNKSEVKEDAPVVEVKEEQVKPEVKAEPVSDDLRWRMMDCVAKTGTIPGPTGLAALFDISRDEAQQGINWLKRTHVVTEKDGYFLARPKGVDANKLVELFKNQDRNPFELRALEALLDVMSGIPDSAD
jgi:hypothetical protein